MTTEKQIAANRENAKKSTGPRTRKGKRRSRRNALRHGLTAETIIDVLENARDYEALAAAINADFRPATNFERELMARLVSLLWRLRRATAIESGLLALQARQRSGGLEVFYRLLDPPALEPPPGQEDETEGGDRQQSERPAPHDAAATARSFLKLAATDGAAFERLGRYETRLWRQLLQIILLLDAIGRGAAADVEGHRLRMGIRRSRTLLWPPVTPSNLGRDDSL